MQSRSAIDTPTFAQALSMGRRGAMSLAAAAVVAIGTSGIASAAPAGGALNLAMIGEPQGLDPVLSTADLVGTIMQHVFEPLYTFDGKWAIAPMLAESLPVVSKDGLIYSIPLRKGVKFHNGKDMDSSDVVASLQRWMEVSARGKSVAKEVESLTAKGPNAIEIKLKTPYAPLLALLALALLTVALRVSGTASPETPAPALPASPADPCGSPVAVPDNSGPPSGPESPLPPPARSHQGTCQH